MILVRNEKSIKEFFLLYPITGIIVLINSFVFLYTTFKGGLTDSKLLYDLGGVSKEAVLNGEYYRLVTYAFIHNGLIHFSMNMVFTILLGPTLEKMLGKVNFILLFFLSIFTAALLSIWLTNDSEVGESGFGFGLFGFYLYLVCFKKSLFDKNSRIALSIFIGISWVISFLNPNASNIAHLGGFIIGFIFALIVSMMPFKTFKKNHNHMLDTK